MYGFTRTAGGQSYISIIATGEPGIHQGLLDASSLAASRDANNVLPPGLPVNAAGATVTSGDAYGIVGPEGVLLGDADIFGNLILQGVLNRDAIEDNLGRALTAAELAGIASGLPGVRLL